MARQENVKFGEGSKLRVLYLICTLCGLAFTSAAIAQQGSGVLSVKVLEEGNDHSIAGASVRLMREHHNFVRVLGNEWTGVDEHTHCATIRNLEAGSDYIVQAQVWSEEWSEQEVSHIIVVAGQTKQIVIHLKRIAPDHASRSAVMKRELKGDERISEPGNLAK